LLGLQQHVRRRHRQSADWTVRNHPQPASEVGLGPHRANADEGEGGIADLQRARDGHLELLAKPFTITKRADGRFDLQLMSRSLEEIDRRIPNIAAALGMPEEHVREQLVNGKAMMIEQRPATVLFNMIFGGPEAFRSAAKSCLVLWALKVGNDEVRGEPYRAVRDFILGHDDGFIRRRTQVDTRPLEQVDAVKQA
jgi:hypothetical protein